MTRGRIISALILIGALSIAGSVYKFYFAAKLEAYDQDRRLKDTLEAKKDELVNTFGGTNPDLVLQEWKAAVAPFNDERNARATYYNFGDWADHDKYPNDGSIIKYWYDDVSKEMIDALYTKVREKRIPFPPDVRSALRSPGIAMWQGRNVEEDVADAELARLSFGLSACELLIDNNVRAVQQIWLWKPRQATELGNILTLQSFGCQIFMTLDDMVKFFDKLRTENRYFNIDAVRITNNTPGRPSEPVLKIELILTQAQFNPIDPAAVITAAPGGSDTGYSAGYSSGYDYGYSSGAPVVYEEPGILDKAWRWFKRYILYTN